MRIFLLLLILTVSSFSQSIYQNIQISSSQSYGETSIMINPKNINQIVASCNINKVFVSSNSGYNWVSSNLTSSSWGVWGDPVNVVDTNGNFYYFHLSNSQSPGYWIDRIVCQKSTNAGYNWNNPGSYTYFNPPKEQDKEWAYVNRKSGPTGNWIYCTWTQFDSYGSTNSLDSSHILFARSTDAGETWTTVTRLDKRGGNCVDEDYTVEGAVPTTGPNGQVYVAWAGPNGSNDFKIFFDRSTDGGNTWLTNDIIAADQPNGWDMNVPGVNRTNGMPITVCDVSGGPYNGYIHIIYADQRNGTTDTDIWYVRSTDGGSTWSNSVRVNDDPPGKHNFLPWMTVDQATGYIYVLNHDKRNYTGYEIDMYMARSTNGGTTWTNERISASPYTSNPTAFFGDYVCITAHDGHIRPIWCRVVSGGISVWTAIIDIPVRKENNFSEVPKGYKLEQNYPNPFNPNTTIRFEIPKDANVKINVYDINGRDIAKITDQFYQAGSYNLMWDASSISSGIYYYTLITDDYKETRRLALAK